MNIGEYIVGFEIRIKVFIFDIWNFVKVSCRWVSYKFLLYKGVLILIKFWRRKCIFSRVIKFSFVRIKFKFKDLVS